jgi:predicted nucleotidyltransferase
MVSEQSGEQGGIALESEENAPRGEVLSRVCETFHVATLYFFGSRAGEVRAWLEEGSALGPGPSDVDVGVRPAPGATLSVEEKVRLAMALEDVWDVGRVDVVCLPEADPFVAANVIRGERLYARDDYEADEYDLYVLRRAGDLAPLERERIALILGRGR